MKCHAAAILTILLCYLIPSSTIFGKKQMYVVTQIDVITDPGFLMTATLRLFGRDQALNGTMTILEDLYDDVLLKLDLFSDTQRNGEFKPMALELPVMGLCTSLKTYYPRFIKESFITNIHTNFEFNDGNVCPFIKGTYWLKDILLEPAGWVNILPMGFIKLQGSLLRDGQFGGAFALIVNIQTALYNP